MFKKPPVRRMSAIGRRRLLKPAREVIGARPPNGDTRRGDRSLATLAPAQMDRSFILWIHWSTLDGAERNRFALGKAL